MSIASYLDSLAAKGRYTFPSSELEKLGLSPTAIRSALRRLRQKKIIADPVRGFHLILPPQYRALGSMPPEYFIHELMQYLKLPYYVSLLSAAQFYGAAHQQPQQFQVMTTKLRRKGIIECGQARIVFIKRKNVEKIPTRLFNTDYGHVKVASTEATAMDLVTYPHYCAGINHVVTVLTELAEEINPEKLLALTKINTENAWVQRLGYLFDFLGQNQLSTVLEKALEDHRIRQCALQIASPITQAKLNKKWQVWINIELESDL